MKRLGNTILIDQLSNSKILYLILITILSINSLWSQKIRFNQKIHELQPSEIEEIEGCLGFKIKKIFVELNTNDTLRLRRGYTQRYFSEIRLEYNTQINAYNVKILFNRNSALNLAIFQSCFTNFFEKIKKSGKHIIEIEFESDIAIANRLEDFEDRMYSLANNCIERFVVPDQYYHSHSEEAKNFRNAKKEIQFMIRKEFENSNTQLISNYLVKIKQDSLAENKLVFKNFENILRKFNSELDNLLANIINSNR